MILLINKEGTLTENIIQKHNSQETLFGQFASKYYTEQEFKAMGNIVSFKYFKFKHKN